MKYFPCFLLAIFVGLVGWSVYNPSDWHVWWMEMVWVLGVAGALALTYKLFKFSNVAYGIVFVWLCLHTIGAHYTFELVPMDWMKELIGTSRNHYDRIAHFGIGLNSFLLAELYLRKKWMAGKIVAAVFGVVSIVAMAGVWEVIEWVGAVWDGGDAGLAFLGSQGDIWDAQKDIVADLLGSVVGSTLFVLLSNRKESK